MPRKEKVQSNEELSGEVTKGGSYDDKGKLIDNTKDGGRHERQKAAKKE